MRALSEREINGDLGWGGACLAGWSAGAEETTRVCWRSGLTSALGPALGRRQGVGNPPICVPSSAMCLGKGAAPNPIPRVQGPDRTLGGRPMRTAVFRILLLEEQ